MQQDGYYSNEPSNTGAPIAPGHNENAMASNAQAQSPSAPLFEFKYHTEFSGIDNCPPPAAENPATMAYRFAQSTLSDPNNSLPPIKIKPDRFAYGRPQQCCSGFGLSMFTSLPALRSRADKALKNSPNFLKKLGNHYVKISLTKSSGRQTKADSNGHFDLYEYSTFDFSKSVLEHTPL